jgi:hypothetical protein
VPPNILCEQAVGVRAKSYAAEAGQALVSQVAYLLLGYCFDLVRLPRLALALSQIGAVAVVPLP